MNVNQAAFCAVTASAIIAGGAAVAAATTASTVAMVALTILALIATSFATASITAWASSQDREASAAEYFSKVTDHVGVAMAGIFEFASKILVTSLIQGFAEGAGTKARRAIAGPDVTYGHV